MLLTHYSVHAHSLALASAYVRLMGVPDCHILDCLSLNVFEIITLVATKGLQYSCELHIAHVLN